MTDALLTLNTGSSSVKFRLFELSPDLPYLLGGKISGIGGNPQFQAHWQEGSRNESHALPPHDDIDAAMAYVLDWLQQNGVKWRVRACAHRIVHGGPDYDQAVELDPKIMDYLHGLEGLAPLHQPHNLAAVTALWRRDPDLRQFACFDTAFHSHHGPLATEMALPARLRQKGVRRYGFHGLSYAWISHRLKCDFPDLAKGRVVAAHLGNGASVCALQDGKSIDTSMGLTALDGLPMGTRCGALDPGAVLYIQRALDYSAEDLERILYDESGLQGLSGISNDVKALLESPDPRAAFAIEYFALKAAQQIAMMAVSLGGIDGLVFTGGIGENADAVVAKILGYLQFLPKHEVHVIPANEERIMAMEIYAGYFKVTLQ
jgi:acetate kinase